MIITKEQQNQLTNLLANFQKFEEKYGSISNLLIMKNPTSNKTLFVKYEKNYVIGGEQKIDMVLVKIESNGNLVNMTDDFPNMYSRYAFFGDCTPIDLQNLRVEV
jgi:hypothetical protein